MQKPFRLEIVPGAATVALALLAAPALAQGNAGPSPPTRSALDDPGYLAYISSRENAEYNRVMNECDQPAFAQARLALFQRIDALIRIYPNEAGLLAAGRQIAGAQFPNPCRRVPTPGEVARMNSVGTGSWAPIRDVRFRNGYDRSIRAPYVGELFGSATTFEGPATGIGVTRDGAVGSAPDRDAGLTDRSILLVGGGAAFHFGKVSVRGWYEGGDAATAFDVAPIVGGFNGAVFGGEAPSGSTGIGAGSASLTGTTRTDVSRFKVGSDYELLGPAPRTRVYVVFDYFRDAIDHDMSLAGTVVFPTTTIRFDQTRRQSITDNFFLAGFGAEALLPLTPPGPDGTGLSIRLNGTAQAYLLDTNFFASEHNQSNFGAVSDQDFTLVFEGSDQTVGVHARGQLNLEYVATPGFSVFAGATAEWFSDGGAVFNPNSGTQIQDGFNTGFEHAARWSYGGLLGARFRF